MEGLENLSQEEREMLNNAVEESFKEVKPIDVQHTNTSRFSSAEWYEEVQKTEVTIAGLGGIGSWTALLISRLNPLRMYLVDPDVVDRSNLGGQLYNRLGCGYNKTDETVVNLSNFSNYNSVVSIAGSIENTVLSTKVLITGFDNMPARFKAFRRWSEMVKITPKKDRKKCLFIDGRMAAEEIQIFCIRGDDDYYMEKYETEFLFSSEEAEPTVCSYKQTSYCASLIGGLITNLFINHCHNLCYSIIPRSLPFYTTYNALTMFLEAKS